MGDFFHGWRRKAGCITLLVACIFGTGWVRSFHINDQFPFPSQNHTTFLLFVSKAGRLVGLYVAIVKRGSPNVVSEDTVYDIPYWSIVIPLTLLSAYLLISKPRKLKSGPTQI